MQLNLRDLFWLIFVSAVATMWWIDRSKLAARIDALENPKFLNVDPFGPDPPPINPPTDPLADPFGLPAPAAAAPAPAPAADPFD